MDRQDRMEDKSPIRVPSTKDVIALGREDLQRDEGAIAGTEPVPLVGTVTRPLTSN